MTIRKKKNRTRDDIDLKEKSNKKPGNPPLTTAEKKALRRGNFNSESVMDKEFNYKMAKRTLLRRSYYHFFKWSFNILLPNDKFVDAPHIKYLCDKLQKEVERIERGERKTEDLIINIPPRTSKSLITSIIFNAWVWTRIPSAKFICVSYDDQLSIINATQTRDLLDSDEYRYFFGDYVSIRQDSNAKSLFENTRGGRRVSKTTGSNITGHSGMFLILDDPQNAKTVMSEAKRAESINYYTQQLYNRLTPVNLGVRIIVQQRLQEQDLTGYLLEKERTKKRKKYHHINLPAIESSEIKPPLAKFFYNNGLLDPIRLDRGTLSDMEDTLGVYGYSSQYLQDPVPVEGGILKPDWIGVRVSGDISRDVQKSPIHFFLDTAYTEKTSNDPTAILAAFRKGNEIYITRCEDKRLEFPKLLKYIKEFVSEYGYSSGSMIYVEPKASGKSVVQALKDDTMLNIVEGVAPDVDKITRLFGISPIVESRRVNIIQGGWNDPFIKQVCSISPERKPPHDDMADTLIMAVNQLLVYEQFDFGFL